MENVLTIQGLTKNFGRLCAVNNLNLEIQRGQVFGMLGPNGSGKTTTLGMLMGVINPTQGSFSWFGQPPTHHLRKKIGAVLEHPIFYPYLSGRKNLELMCLIKEAPPENVQKVLALVELSGRQDDKYRTYSLGMKQRLAIASALLNDPIVLILDEPTNGLDPMGIAEIRDIIRRIANDGKTIILASHLLDEVQKVCTHFAILRKGNLVHSGPVDDVGKGEESVEVMAYHDDLALMLESFEGTLSMKRETQQFVVKMKPGFHANDINRYLFEKGVTATHLVTQKKSLEKQFLEILAEADHAAPAKN
ncbi:MAG TPA: ABC transporter ATP-binding protein [Cyclobacteriaceae bacterium]|nr:ABC transporter ATP-binding protein [Cyclobacteriaceae bacterium]